MRPSDKSEYHKSYCMFNGNDHKRRESNYLRAKKSVESPANTGSDDKERREIHGERKRMKKKKKEFCSSFQPSPDTSGLGCGMTGKLYIPINAVSFNSCAFAGATIGLFSGEMVISTLIAHWILFPGSTSVGSIVVVTLKAVKTFLSFNENSVNMEIFFIISSASIIS